MAYNPLNPNGSATAANSQPVVIASDQAAIAGNITQVGGASLALGQALAAASVPVVLTASQLTSLTAPVLAAGTNIIGQVSINQTTLGTTNRAYVNTAPLIPTGVSFNRVADTNAYASGDLVANSTTAASCNIGNSGFTLALARANDIPGRLSSCRLRKSGTSNTNAFFRVHWFNINPLTSAPANGDNGVYTPANKAGYLGFMDINFMNVFGDGCVGIAAPSQGNYLDFTPASGTQNLFALLEARGAYTPASGETFTLEGITE